MKKNVFLLLGLAFPLLSSTALAWTFRLPKQQPSVSIIIPQTWTTAERPGGYSCESPDQAANLIFETISEDKVEALIGETMDWLVKNRKVEIDKSTVSKKELDDNGLNWKTVKWEGRDDIAPLTVMLAFTGIGNDKVLMLVYWVTKTGEQEHQKELIDILESTKPIQAGGAAR